LATDRFNAVITAVGLSLLAMAGCRTAAQTGVMIGALAGAGIGQALGGSTEATAVGTALGAAAGYVMGHGEDEHNLLQEPSRIREEMDYGTVTIRNADGSIRRIRLRQEGIGYIGTRGEYYDHLPTEDELKGTYGF
jgi:hypothetical protein